VPSAATSGVVWLSRRANPHCCIEGDMMTTGLIIAGNLYGFIEFAQGRDRPVERFIREDRELVNRHLHSHPVFAKFLGDTFVYIYDLEGSTAFAGNVLHSATVLQEAYRRAARESSDVLYLLGRASRGGLPECRGLGIAAGHVFLFDDLRHEEDAACGPCVSVLPVLADRRVGSTRQWNDPRAMPKEWNGAALATPFYLP